MSGAAMVERKASQVATLAPKRLPKWAQEPLKGLIRQADQTLDLVLHCRGGGI